MDFNDGVVVTAEMIEAGWKECSNKDIPVMRIYLAMHALSPAQAGEDAKTDHDTLYLRGSCTESECKLCRTPVELRKPKMSHAGISAYDEQSNAAPQVEALADELEELPLKITGMAWAKPYSNVILSVEQRDLIIAALRRLAAESVPAGWRLVPVEPTDDMKLAGWKAYEGEGEREHRLWRAMLFAAPQTGKPLGK